MAPRTGGFAVIGLLTRTPLPSGTYECATLLEQKEERLVLGPDTPDSIPGNAQYVFLLRVPPGPSRSIDIVWPHLETESRPGFDYPHNANFCQVLDQVIFLRKEHGDWQRLTTLRTRPHGVELDLPALDSPAWLSVGIPYFACEFEALMTHLRNDPRWQIESIGTSPEGRTLPGCLRRARTPETSRGLFLISAYQHYGEWAGLHAVDALMRDLPPEADAFDWAVVPCVNIDGLHRGWRGDLMHRGDALDQEHGGNLNRAWNPPCLPESKAAAAFFKKAAALSPSLHALDLHMGWSNPEHSGGGLTVYHPGEIPETLHERMRAFTDFFFQRVPIQDFAWEHSRLQGAGATPWFTRELGCPAQTVEFSRFQSNPHGQPDGPISTAYYRSLGPLMAQSLVHFYES